MPSEEDQAMATGNIITNMYWKFDEIWKSDRQTYMHAVCNTLYP